MQIRHDRSLRQFVVARISIFVWTSTFFWGCGFFKPAPIAQPRNVDARNMLIDGSFESDGAWIRSAPPDYSGYGSIDFDRRVHRSGSRSAHVVLHRHPRGGDGKVLHGWTQTLAKMPARANIRFGGWVATAGAPPVRLGMEYELAQPLNGRTFFSIDIAPVPNNSKLTHVEKRLELPANVTRAVFIVGISGLGEAWFDDVYLEIE